MYPRACTVTLRVSIGGRVLSCSIEGEGRFAAEVRAKP